MWCGGFGRRRMRGGGWEGGAGGRGGGGAGPPRAAPLSSTTGVIWRYGGPLEAGRHPFEVRCVDGAGENQSPADTGPFPSGATGIHSLTRTL